MISTASSRQVFVNSSLAKFVETVCAVGNRFPFYDRDADEDEIEAVSDQLFEIIRRIDPPAAEPDRYWSKLVDDSRIGDLNTEGILAVTNHRGG